MKIIFLLFILLLSFCSFSQRVFSLEQKNDFLPKKHLKYKLKNENNFINSSIIDTNAMYISREFSTIHQDTFYSVFIRFYEDGRVFFSFSYYGNPTNEQFNDSTYGKFGRYIIQKDSIITIELYQDRYTGIEYLHAKKTDEGIQFFSHGSRNPKWILNKKESSGGYYEKIQLM
jgi:adenine C2-methylase RlmN of 23S rRNA A2503 and tRNA A37